MQGKPLSGGRALSNGLEVKIDLSFIINLELEMYIVSSTSRVPEDRPASYSACVFICPSWVYTRVVQIAMSWSTHAIDSSPQPTNIHCQVLVSYLCYLDIRSVHETQGQRSMTQPSSSILLFWDYMPFMLKRGIRATIGCMHLSKQTAEVLQATLAANTLPICLAKPQRLYAHMSCLGITMSGLAWLWWAKSK